MISIRSLRPSYHGTPAAVPTPTTYRARYHSRQVGWSDAEIAELKTRWMRGDPASAIADDIGRSRNSVLGKISRLNLKRGESA